MNDTILLVNPWITDFAAYDYWLKPLGMLYIAGVLRAHDYRVGLIDCMDRCDPDLLTWQGIASPKNRLYGTGKFYREIIPKPAVYQSVPRRYARYGFPLSLFREKLKRCGRPGAALVTSGMTYWYPGVQLVIQEIRRAYPELPIVLGGIYATLCREHAIATAGADYVIAGEGELAALQLVDRLLGVKRDYSHFPKQLDELPLPAFDLYQNLKYATVMTSRGCPLNVLVLRFKPGVGKIPLAHAGKRGF